MWTKGRKGTGFQKAELKESSAALDNPGCGWYHVYPFVIKTPAELPSEEIKACISDISKDEHLVLVRIDIGAFRSCEMPEEALEIVCRIFALFHDSQKQMIVRFAYDCEGRGMEREPGDISLVKRHMEQLGEVVCKFASDILVLQGIFVGSWGEMHHSKFLAVSYMSELMNSLHRAVKGKCYLGVRTPEQWRAIMGYAGTEKVLKKRVGLFNDGMFGSSTDLGTYKEDGRQEELDWQERFVSSVPNGGEVIAGERLIGYRQAAQEMKKMCLSYLNSSYQQRQLDYWKGESVEQPGCWRGLSGYEYIGRHLGSRFVICDVKETKKGLEIVIENRGFSGLHEAAECFLITEDKGGQTVCRLAGTDMTEWRGGEKIILHAPLPGMERAAGESRLFFQMRRKRDGRILRFANQDAEDKVLLGTFRHR